MFASAIGTPLDAANVRREFGKITEAAGLGTGWAPRDLRHTFVSLMSADGVPWWRWHACGRARAAGDDPNSSTGTSCVPLSPRCQGSGKVVHAV